MEKEPKELIVNCPYVNCRGVLFRRLTATSEEVQQMVIPIAYESLCPHCKKKIRVRIGLTAKAEPVF